MRGEGRFVAGTETGDGNRNANRDGNRDANSIHRAEKLVTSLFRSP